VQATFRPIEAELKRIEALIVKNELEAAASSLNVLRGSSGDDPRVYSLGAELAFAANNPDAALLATRAALDLAPNASQVHFQRARALEALGRLGEAIEACRAAVDANPKMLPAVELAVYVGRRLGDTSAAEAMLRAAQRATPESLPIWLAMGKFLARDRRAEALDWFEKVLEAEPENVEALLVSASLNYDLGHVERARALIERAHALNGDDERVAFELARINDTGVAQLPLSRVQGLFDEYAERFDTHLVGALKYSIPQLVAKKIRERFPDLRLNLLDLGCGTGLLGVYLGRIEGYFVGVDLSEKMVQQASRHGIYSRFHLVEMVEALAATAEREYEVITACDVVVYLADLTAFVTESHRVLRAGGALIFSCESAGPGEANSVLRPSLRYAHQADWAQSLCRTAGFEDVVIESFVVRYENDQPVSGFVVTAIKASG
jgi:predicted TPR repeat methyltransferase